MTFEDANDPAVGGRLVRHRFKESAEGGEANLRTKYCTRRLAQCTGEKGERETSVTLGLVLIKESSPLWQRRS